MTPRDPIAGRCLTIGIDARKANDFGIGTYIRHLVAGLAQRDLTNRYVLFASADHPFDNLPDNFEVQIERSRGYSLAELTLLPLRMRRHALDLFHATHYVTPLWLPCPSIVTIHDIIHLLFPQYLPNRLALLYARWMIPRSARRAARVLAVSQSTADDLVALGIDEGKIAVVYNGVDDAYFEAAALPGSPSPASEAGVQRVLFVGNPKPHKNLPRVLDAFAQVVRQRAAAPSPSVRLELRCLGVPEPLHPELLRRARELGVEDRLDLRARVPPAALPAEYAAADVLAFPSLYEGFGLPVVEAMAAGTAVVTSNGSSLGEIAGGAALLVDPESTEELRQALARVLEDDQLRDDLASRGRARAREFQWSKTVAQVHEIYLGVAAEGALRGGRSSRHQD